MADETNHGVTEDQVEDSSNPHGDKGAGPADSGVTHGNPSFPLFRELPPELRGRIRDAATSSFSRDPEGQISAAAQNAWRGVHPGCKDPDVDLWRKFDKEQRRKPLVDKMTQLPTHIGFAWPSLKDSTGKDTDIDAVLKLDEKAGHEAIRMIRVDPSLMKGVESVTYFGSECAQSPSPIPLFLEKHPTQSTRDRDRYLQDRMTICQQLAALSGLPLHTELSLNQAYSRRISSDYRAPVGSNIITAFSPNQVGALISRVKAEEFTAIADIAEHAGTQGSTDGTVGAHANTPNADQQAGPDPEWSVKIAMQPVGSRPSPMISRSAMNNYSSGSGGPRGTRWTGLKGFDRSSAEPYSRRRGVDGTWFNVRPHSESTSLGHESGPGIWHADRSASTQWPMQWSTLNHGVSDSADKAASSNLRPEPKGRRAPPEHKRTRDDPGEWRAVLTRLADDCGLVKSWNASRQHTNGETTSSLDAPPVVILLKRSENDEGVRREIEELWKDVVTCNLFNRLPGSSLVSEGDLKVELED